MGRCLVMSCAAPTISRTNLEGFFEAVRDRRAESTLPLPIGNFLGPRHGTLPSLWSRRLRPSLRQDLSLRCFPVRACAEGGGCVLERGVGAVPRRQSLLDRRLRFNARECPVLLPCPSDVDGGLAEPSAGSFD